MEALNRKKFLTFAQQCKGAGVTEVHVDRKEAGGAVRLLYNAREPRSGKLHHGEWAVERRDRSAEEVEAKVKEFLDLAARDFAVTRHDVEAPAASRGERPPDILAAAPAPAPEPPAGKKPGKATGTAAGDRKSAAGGGAGGRKSKGG